MSAWYVMSSLGIYPVDPASSQYILTTPLHQKAVLSLAGGKTFSIETTQDPMDYPYIKSVELNGKPYNKTYIDYADLLAGGVLKFELTQSATEGWGTKAQTWPVDLKNVREKPAFKAALVATK